MRIDMAIRSTIKVTDAQTLYAQDRLNQAVVRQTGDTKLLMRQEVTRGLSARAGNTITARVSIQPDASAIGVLSSRWIRRRRGRIYNVLDAYLTGTTILPVEAGALAIPTEAAGRGPRGSKMTPRRWEEMHGIKLQYVPARFGRPPLLVAPAIGITAKGRARTRVSSKTGRVSHKATVVIFFLKRSTRLPSRLNMDTVRQKTIDGLADKVNFELAKLYGD